MPVTLIGEAVYARCLSAHERRARGGVARSSRARRSSSTATSKAFIEDIRQALLASKIVSYAQGFMLLREAAKEYKWNLNYGGIALVWRGGLHHPLARSWARSRKRSTANPNLSNLLLDPYFTRRRSSAASRPGGAWSSQGGGSGHAGARRSPRRWRSSTATAADACRPTCCRPSAITSAPTPTSAWTSRAASSSTRTGRARAARSHPAVFV